MSESLKVLLQQALDITSNASAIPAREFSLLLDIDLKEDESPVTRADRATETFIREALTARFPYDGIYGEEFGVSGLDHNRVWVVDPIDGTKSFVTGVPLFGMLLALIEKGETILGIVRFPALNQVYAAIKGGTATKDGKAIHASNCRALNDAVLFINEPEKIYNADAALFAQLTKAGRGRRMAYDCLPHALVAEGRVDAAIDFDLKPYDYLPLVPVVEEAGGVITDWAGKPLGFDSDGRVVTAATPELHRQMLDLLGT